MSMLQVNSPCSWDDWPTMHWSMAKRINSIKAHLDWLGPEDIMQWAVLHGLSNYHSHYHKRRRCRPIESGLVERLQHQLHSSDFARRPMTCCWRVVDLEEQLCDLSTWLKKMGYMHVAGCDTIRMHGHYATCALKRLYRQAITMHTMLILIQSCNEAPKALGNYPLKCTYLNI